MKGHRANWEREREEVQLGKDSEDMKDHRGLQVSRISQDFLMFQVCRQYRAFQCQGDPGVLEVQGLPLVQGRLLN